MAYFQICIAAIVKVFIKDRDFSISPSTFSNVIRIVTIIIPTLKIYNVRYIKIYVIYI